MFYLILKLPKTCYSLIISTMLYISLLRKLKIPNCVFNYHLIFCRENENFHCSVLSSSSHQGPDKHMLFSVWAHQQPNQYISPSIYHSRRIHHWSARTKTTINVQSCFTQKISEEATEEYIEHYEFAKSFRHLGILKNNMTHFYTFKFSKCSPL